MKKEHYEHVSRRFNLEAYHETNGAGYWSDDHEGTIEHFRIVSSRSGNWGIRDLRSSALLFIRLPSERLANQVLKYIEETKILFE